jgi:dihydroxyacid dehydratase/phosphogluconate dehydratase
VLMSSMTAQVNNEKDISGERIEQRIVVVIRYQGPPHNRVFGD